MQQTLYGDVLFFINFTMDFLTLYLTTALFRRRLRLRRTVIAAAIGGVYGVVACFLSLPSLLELMIHVGVSYALCQIAFGRRCLSLVAVFYLVGCLLGGAMTALYSQFGSISGTQTVYVDGSYRTVTGEIPLGWMAVVAGLTGAAAIAGGRWAKKERVASECRVGVLDEAGVTLLTGLYDSGNLLRDPIGGQAVIVLRREAFLRVVPEEVKALATSADPTELTAVSARYACRLRLIPSRSVGGEAMLLSYRPRSVTVDGVEKEALLALGDEGFDGKDALVPALLREQ